MTIQPRTYKLNFAEAPDTRPVRRLLIASAAALALSVPAFAEEPPSDPEPEMQADDEDDQDDDIEEVEEEDHGDEASDEAGDEPDKFVIAAATHKAR